jgi:hypothetical protein
LHLNGGFLFRAFVAAGDATESAVMLSPEQRKGSRAQGAGFPFVLTAAVSDITFR